MEIKVNKKQTFDLSRPGGALRWAGRPGDPKAKLSVAGQAPRARRRADAATMEIAAQKVAFVFAAYNSLDGISNTYLT
jgi:hypothetical protein